MTTEIPAELPQWEKYRGWIPIGRKFGCHKCKENSPQLFRRPRVGLHGLLWVCPRCGHEDCNPPHFIHKANLLQDKTETGPCT